MISLLTASLLPIFGAILSPIAVSLAQASDPIYCGWTCPLTTTGYDGEILYNTYEYQLSNDFVCGYGTINSSASVGGNNGTACLYSWDGGIYNSSLFDEKYCPSQAAQCCASEPLSSADQTECTAVYSCTDKNPLGNNLVTGIVSFGTLNCTYELGIEPCVYDIATGCLLQQQGALQCPGISVEYFCPQNPAYTPPLPTVVFSSTATPSPTLTFTTSPPATTTSSSNSSAALPPGWQVSEFYSCAQDTPERVLADVKGYTLANNTPAVCLSICAAGNYGWAGVEYGDECYCGTSDWTYPGLPIPLNAINCSMPCAGDSSQTCGGPWAIQLYEWNDLPEAEAAYEVPSTWISFPAWAFDCYFDDPGDNSVLPDATLFTLQNNAPGTCIAICEANGFTLAGVENGDECWCGMSYPGWPGPVPTPNAGIACDIPCPVAPNLNCGGSGVMVLYEQMVYQIYP